MVDASKLNNNEERTRAETDEIVIDNIPIPAASIIESYTSRFESKLTFGDYSKDSDQLLSTWVQSSWSGGMLIDSHIEGATDQRGRWARAWTMSSEQLSLPPYPGLLEVGPVITSADTDAQGIISMPLIEIQGVMYFAMGKELWKVTADPYNWDETANALRVAALPGYAQGQAIIGEDDTTFTIPLGINGVVTVRSHTHPTNPETLMSHTTAIPAIALAKWDGKDFALTISRYLRVNMGSGWEPASSLLRLPGDEKPRGLEVFYDQGGNQAIYLVSDKRLWAYDHEVEKIYPSTLTWPKHHNNGLGFTSWRDDALYISSGFSVTRYTRDGVRTDIGLDRDDGIPADRVQQEWGRFYDQINTRPGLTITSMVGTQNFIAALVQLGTKLENNDPKTGPYAVCVWNEGGWHVLYEEDLPPFPGRGAGRFPIGLMVTENVGGYRLWWGEGASKHQGGLGHSSYEGKPRLHTIPIPRSFHSPRKQVLENLPRFATYGYYETGWFDAGMEGFLKTWSHLELNLVDPGDGLGMGGEVKAFYRTEDNPTLWKELGTATWYGRTVLPFGVDDKGVPRGDTSQRIEIRLELTSVTSSRTPIISSFVLKFIKLALPGRAWQVTAPLDSEQWKGMGPSELSAWIARMTYKGGFGWLMTGDKKRRVRVSQVQRIKGTGDVPYENVQINLIEVPIPGDPVWGGEE